MAKKKLTIKGITFPDFGDDDSKKNFRLMFFIGYTDKDGNESATIVTKPDAGQWQWRKASKNAFLPPKIVGDSAELNTTVLKTGDGGKIPASSHKITEIDGDITDITVQFLDVFDASVGDFLKSKVLPQLIEQLKGLGINPIDLIPVPGVFTTVLKNNVNVNDLATKFQTFLTKEKKDKLLHSISREYKGENPFVLKEEKVWNTKKRKKGTYGVTIGVQ